MGRNRHYANNADRQQAFRDRNYVLRTATERLWEALFWAHAAGDPVARECIVSCSSGVQAIAHLADHFAKVGGQARVDLLAEERFVGVKPELFNAHEQVLKDIAAWKKEKGIG